MTVPERVVLDLWAELARDFPAEVGPARGAIGAILEAIAGRDMRALGKHSPALENYPWQTYLELSAARMVRAGAMLRRAGVPAGGRVLDFGAYFGNFALFLRRLGYAAEAADNYAFYNGAFDPCLQVLEAAGVQVISLAGEERELSSLPAARYDAVLCLGVIEHLPHTPKALLGALDRALRPGGTLVLETPNLAYLYKRERLANGDSIFPPIEQQFHVEPPFEGHHREYVTREVTWMLGEIGHQVDEVELFNFSLNELEVLQGADLDRYRRMQAEPDLRELIMTRSTKPAGRP